MWMLRIWILGFRIQNSSFYYTIDIAFFSVSIYYFVRQSRLYIVSTF